MSISYDAADIVERGGRLAIIDQRYRLAGHALGLLTPIRSGLRDASALRHGNCGGIGTVFGQETEHGFEFQHPAQGRVDSGHYLFVIRIFFEAGESFIHRETSTPASSAARPAAGMEPAISSSRSTARPSAITMPSKPSWSRR